MIPHLALSRNGPAAFCGLLLSENWFVHSLQAGAPSPRQASPSLAAAQLAYPRFQWTPSQDSGLRTVQALAIQPCTYMSSLPGRDVIGGRRCFAIALGSDVWYDSSCFVCHWQPREKPVSWGAGRNQGGT